ncbi:TPA: helix-turn-helix transcriptional regulator [Bacillus cereus]|nr:helix-turn-helix transcriptional regulator [Bacillus cereus]
MSSKTGERIKKLRMARGWGLEELASRVGRTKSTLSGVENNKSSAGRKLIEALSEEFKVSTDYLLGISDVEKSVYQVEGNVISIDMTGLKEKKILTDIEFSILETLLKGIEDKLK